jgi:hypothetical protein
MAGLLHEDRDGDADADGDGVGGGDADADADGESAEQQYADLVCCSDCLYASSAVEPLFSLLRGLSRPSGGTLVVLLNEMRSALGRYFEKKYFFLRPTFYVPREVAKVPLRGALETLGMVRRPLKKYPGTSGELLENL